jgi:hypothetical protein
MTPSLRQIAVLFAGALMLWQGCTSVLATPFQLTFTMLQLAVALSFVFLALLHETKKSIYAFGVVFAAVVATYSLAGGLLLWPILLLAAFLLKIGTRQTAAIAICALAAGGVYFIGYERRTSLHVLPLFQHPAYAAGFVASFLGMPFGSVAAGVLSVLLFAGCLTVAVRRGVWNKQLAIVVFGIYLYTLLSAVLTAAGRMEWTDPTFKAARAARYITVPMAAWGALIVAAVWLLPMTRLARFTLPLVLAAAALVFTGCLREQELVKRSAQEASQLQIAALMLRNKVEDDATLINVYPSAAFVRERLPHLRSKRLSIYAHGTDNWLGQEVKSLWPFAQPVPGQITRVYPLEGGFEIYGWSDSPFLQDEHAVLFTNLAGKIVGFGRRPRAGFPMGFGTWETPPALAFVGFVRSSHDAGPFTAWVWAHPNKTLHRMGEPIAIPDLSVAAKSGAPLRGVTWEMDFGFHLNGQLVSDENGPAPSGPIYGSFGSNKMGELRSNDFEAPDHCLVLPVLHGLSAYGQSVKVMDAETKAVIAVAPMFDGRSVWERWQIGIPPSVRRAFVFAQDAGEGGNQWVAIGTPAACR